MFITQAANPTTLHICASRSLSNHSSFFALELYSHSPCTTYLEQLHHIVRYISRPEFRSPLTNPPMQGLSPTTLADCANFARDIPKPINTNQDVLRPTSRTSRHSASCTSYGCCSTATTSASRHRSTHFSRSACLPGGSCCADGADGAERCFDQKMAIGMPRRTSNIDQQQENEKRESKKSEQGENHDTCSRKV